MTLYDWDRIKRRRRRALKSSEYEYRPTTFGSSISTRNEIDKTFKNLQDRIDQLTKSSIESRNLSIYGSMDPFLYGEEGYEFVEPHLKDLKEKVQQLTKTVVNQKQEDEKLRMARKDPVGFSSLFPEKYVDFLLDDKLNMAINTKDIFKNTENAIDNMRLGPLPSFNDTPEEEQLRIENAKLKAELSSTERQLAVLVKPPTWRTLLKEWFMYKVLKRPKPQPLYLGPYR